jgi:hypothetical protein
MGQEIIGNIQQSFTLAQQSPTGTITGLESGDEGRPGGIDGGGSDDSF